jgi:mRNA interferase RelE/StbE
VHYGVELKPRAMKDLKVIPPADRRRIFERVAVLGDDLQGDVKRLTNHTPEFRLRVGSYRVLFEVEGASVVVYRVVHRKDAYR